MDYIDAKKMSERIESNPNAWHSKTLKEKNQNPQKTKYPKIIYQNIYVSKQKVPLTFLI